MKDYITCTLCGAKALPFERAHGRDYFECPDCGAVLMDPGHWVSVADEIYRYKTHDNDVEDPRYQEFVSPLVEAVAGDCRPGSRGLDYGSGTGPVAAKLLRDRGYEVSTYDPFFDLSPPVFQNTYDYIIASEVVEHFHNPAKEFRLLKEMLKPGGHLYCMTLRIDEDVDFQGWHYKNDETHVIFYREETAEWIRSAFGYSGLRVEERLFILQK